MCTVESVLHYVWVYFNYSNTWFYMNSNKFDVLPEIISTPIYKSHTDTARRGVHLAAGGQWLRPIRSINTVRQHDWYNNQRRIYIFWALMLELFWGLPNFATLQCLRKRVIVTYQTAGMNVNNIWDNCYANDRAWQYLVGTN